MQATTAASANTDPRTRVFDDRRLVAAVRGGDEHGFELLFARYRAPIGAYIASLVRDHGYSEDITQEVFISALRSLRASDRPITFKPWIYEIARNACIDRHRRMRRGEEVAAGGEHDLDAEPSRLVGARAAPQDATESRDRFAELCRALMELPAADRRLLVMREFEGRSYREIVEQSGLSTAAVESALFRARRRLLNASLGLRQTPAPEPSRPPKTIVARAPHRLLRRAQGNLRLPVTGAVSTG